MNITDPLYVQLMENIKYKIVNGDLKIGDRIPSERTMAEQYGINRLTVRNALKKLEKEGILQSYRGKGTYVMKMPEIEGKISLGNAASMSLSAQIRQNGMKSSRRVLSFKKKVVDNELQMVFANETFVYEIIRLSMINDHPYALQKAYLPCSIFKEAERFDFSNFSLYEYMDDQGHRPNQVESQLRIEHLPKEYLEIMNVDENKYMFLFDYFGFDENNQLVEYTISYHHSEYTVFEYTTSVAN
ncbi:MAG: GntR family transcriptional regulator [Erysipelotrichaceae bacterium]|nr:GntR family transcriptional regulator [Erysipelotrichaceae bacterium]